MLNFLTNNNCLMKKLGKLQIHSEKLLSNDDLMTLKGGYGIDKGWLTCKVNGVTCWDSSILSCDYARESCDAVCGSWTELICSGW
jgi:hypothetical protein